MSFDWAQAFSADLNSGSQNVTAAVANGDHNSAGGNVVTTGAQSVGDSHGFLGSSEGGSGFGSLNVGVQTVTAAVGNGDHNHVDGNVTTSGAQSVGDSHGFSAGYGDSGADYGHINVGVQTVTAAIGNGSHNHIDGDVTTSGLQSVGDSHGFFGSYDDGHINIGVQNVTAAVANGDHNHVDGSVVTSGFQDVGDHGFFAMPF